jgi:putative hydrolase of HD superfamily
MTQPALPALLALLPLEELPRTGWLQHGVRPAESIASHVTGTCFTVLALAPRVTPPLDTDRAIALALVHDAPEALLSDLPKSASRLMPNGAKAQMEDRAAAELLPPLSALAHERFAEYRAGKTREARFVRLCDRLQMGVRAVGYHRRGVRGLEQFARTIEALDCGEFAPAAALQREILAALG